MSVEKSHSASYYSTDSTVLLRALIQNDFRSLFGKSRQNERVSCMGFPPPLIYINSIFTHQELMPLTTTSSPMRYNEIAYGFFLRSEITISQRGISFYFLTVQSTDYMKVANAFTIKSVWSQNGIFDCFSRVFTQSVSLLYPCQWVGASLR